MNNLMLDLEFLGKPPLARLCTVGAVFFDPMTGALGAQFYARVKWADKNDQALPFEASTIAWWMAQPEAATFEIVDEADRYPLYQVLGELTKFIEQHNTGGVSSRDGLPLVNVWGNGSDCDCVVLRGAYDALFLPTPWHFWETRDVRTIVQLAKDLRGVDIKKQVPFTGTKHHALHDAVHQAQYVSLGHSLLAGGAV